MMSKTHLSVGMASSAAASLAISPSATIGEYAFILAGGAIGGVLADIDILKNDYKHDALLGQVLAVCITVIACGIDLFFNYGVYSSIASSDKITLLIGSLGFLIFWIKGYRSSHRAITHSFIAAILFSLFIAMIYPLLGRYCLIGYISHMVLDLTNKKGIQIFYPSKKSICFRWFYANKTANKVFMYIGLATLIILVVYRYVLL